MKKTYDKTTFDPLIIVLNIFHEVIIFINFIPITSISSLPFFINFLLLILFRVSPSFYIAPLSFGIFTKAR